MLTNPLDILFRDIRRELYAQELAKSKAPKPPTPPKLSTYANPQNWTLGRVIELIHHDEGSLGLFQEYFHKLSPTARRLLPAAKGLTASTTETVFGDFWLHPKFQASSMFEDSEAETAAIIARFNELMNALDDEEDFA